MFIIGITGGTGSGKTTLVNNIINSFPKKEIIVISQDSYYNKTDSLNLEERKSINFDHPDAIDFNLLVNHVQALKDGKVIKQPTYSFIQHNRTSEIESIQPKKIIIVEGILIFYDKRLLDLFDLKIFIDVPADERLIRRINRDTKERGRDLLEVTERYNSTLKPMHNLFIKPTKIFADLIIPNSIPNIKALDVLKLIIRQKL